MLHLFFLYIQVNIIILADSYYASTDEQDFVIPKNNDPNASDLFEELDTIADEVAEEAICSSMLNISLNLESLSQMR